MRKTLFILLLIPFAVSAQKPEIGLGAGYGLATTTVNTGLNNIGWKMNVNALVNIVKMQFGIGTEFRPVAADMGLIMPYAVANRKFGLCKGYTYAGLAAGWGRFSTNFFGPEKSTININFYNIELHGGVVFKFSKHFGANSELGIRRTTWYDTDGVSALNFSLTAGVRYGF